MFFRNNESIETDEHLAKKVQKQRVYSYQFYRLKETKQIIEFQNAEWTLPTGKYNPYTTNMINSSTLNKYFEAP